MADRALVTGAAGFVGCVLVRHLQAEGWEVVCSDIHGDRGVLVCDVANAGDVQALFAEAGEITHVFHLAAQTFVPESHQNPAPTFETNLMGTVNLVQAMRDAAPDARLICIGSADAYGPPQYLPVDETHPLRPQNPYAISKAAADAYCAYAAQAHSLDIVRMRPFNHSGPGQSERFALSSFAKQIAAIEAGNRPAVLRVGNLSAARDFSHVEDVVHAYALAAKLGASGGVYNVCSGMAHTMQTALDALLAMSTAKITVEPDPGRMRPVDVPELVGSFARLSEATGWHATQDFGTMLFQILEYWRQNTSV